MKLANESKRPISGAISALPTIIPPKSMNSEIGGRTRQKSAPSRRPSTGSGTIAAPEKARAGRGGARDCAAIVRVLSTRQELHVGSGTQVVNRSRAGQKIGVPELAVGRLANQRTQVKVGLFAAIVEAGGAALAVARNPKRAG